MLPKKVGSLEDQILLEEGDTLELVTGHVTTGKPSRFFSFAFYRIGFGRCLTFCEKRDDDRLIKAEQQTSKLYPRFVKAWSNAWSVLLSSFWQ